MSLSTLLKTNDLCVSKNILGTDKDYRHSYIRFYDHIFSSFSPKSILEIGVAHGASLCLWKLYFPNSKVMGIDNSKKPLHNLARQLVKRNLIEIKICDAYRLKTRAKFDLIIDDGLHSPNANLTTLLYGLTKVKIGGYVVIEDIAREALPFWVVVSALLPDTYEQRIYDDGLGLIYSVKNMK